VTEPHTTRTPPIQAKKSMREGHVSISVRLKSGWSGDRVKLEGGTELTVAEARGLAHALLAKADDADAKVAEKAAKEASRKKWSDREVAAGRMKIISFGGRP
jgi:hypothetical protein